MNKRRLIVKAEDRISGLLLVIVAIATCVEAIRLGIGSVKTPGPGFFPFLVGLVLGTLSLALFFKATFSNLKDRQASESLRMVLTQKKVWYIILALIAYGLLLEWFGFLFTTAVIFAFILGVVESQKWWFSILGGLAASASCYALFCLALGVRLPGGILGP